MRLRCTVRGCGRPLARGGRSWVCAERHSFDVARAGFVNLLQPQDKKAAAPGDAREVVAARRRLLDAGVAAPLSAALREILADTASRGTPPAALAAERREPAGAAVLDVGCGEGTHLAAVCAPGEGRGAAHEGWGVDISVPAIEAAAKRHPGLEWVVANADRGLPFLDGAFTVVLSITGRRDPAELARVLVPGGLAVLAVPAADDLRELRAAVQGEAREEDRLDKVRAELADAPFREVADRTVRHRPRLDPAALRDVLATTYRGARRRERARADALDAPMDVTFSWRIAAFERRTG